MSAETQLEFVDANLLVYALDASAGVKRTKAEQLLQRLWKTGIGFLSVQVLQEFFVALSCAKCPSLSRSRKPPSLREFATWKTFAPTAQDVLAAIALHKEARLSFWGAMVLQTASELGVIFCGPRI